MTAETTDPAREWAVVFTRPNDGPDRPGWRTCEDELHARVVRDTFPTRYLPAYVAQWRNDEWVQVGDVRTS